MKYLNEIKEGENILEIYFCKEKQTAVTKSGKTYYSLTLQDKTSLINAKIWDITPNIGNFEVGDYIYIMGTASSYQNAIQLSITKLKKATEHEYDISNHMPVTKYDRKEMYKEVVALIGTVKDIYLNTLLKKFFIDDKELVKKNS